jgi:hypothetical protein
VKEIFDNVQAAQEACRKHSAETKVSAGHATSYVALPPAPVEARAEVGRVRARVEVSHSGHDVVLNIGTNLPDGIEVGEEIEVALAAASTGKGQT